MPSYHTITRGALEGRVAAKVPCGGIDWDEPQNLVEAILRVRAPGLTAVELEDAPWGEPALDRGLLLCAADARCQGVEVIAQRSVSETRWASAPVWWVLDASPLLRVPTESPQLIHAINDLPFLPQPAEVIVENPHFANLSAVVLDEIHTRLDPEHAWIYVEDREAAKRATRFLASASTGWGVRVAT